MKRKFEQTEENRFDIITFIPREISKIVFTFFSKKKKQDVKLLRLVCKSWNEKVEFWLKEYGVFKLSDCDIEKVGVRFYRRILPKKIVLKYGFWDNLVNTRNVTHVKIIENYDELCLRSLLHVTSLDILDTDCFESNDLKKFKNLSTLYIVSGKPYIDFEMTKITHLELFGKQAGFQKVQYFPNLKSLKLVDMPILDIIAIIDDLSRIDSLMLDCVYESYEDKEFDFNGLKFGRLKVAKIESCSCSLFINLLLDKSNLEHLMLRDCETHDEPYNFKPMKNLKILEIYCENLSRLFTNDSNQFWTALYSCTNLECFILKEKYTIEIDYKDHRPEKHRKEAFKTIKDRWKLLISMPNIRFVRWKSNVLNYQFSDISFTNFGFLDS